MATSAVSYPLTSIEGIDENVALALRAAGVRSSVGLLECASTPRGRKVLAAKTGFDEKQLLCWANMADRMRVNGVRREYAALLSAAGVDTIRELACRNPRKLAQAMRDANDKRKLVSLVPTEKSVTRWIAHAKDLQKKITY